MPTKAVLFDLFGTLLHIPATTSPYLQLLASARPGVDARKIALTFNGGVDAVADQVGSPLPKQNLAEIARAVAREVDSAQLYPETLEALAMVRRHGLKIAVSSNLAASYSPVRELLEGLVDHWCFSFEKGVTKPDVRMFHEPAAALGVQPRECLMIGDSVASDRAGALAAGMDFVLVDRRGRVPGPNVASSLITALQLGLGVQR